MKNSANISVIIPCHNVAPWIIDAVRSVGAQTLKPGQIILVDDASTDDSVERALSAGVPLEILRVKRHNAAAARNDGILVARGDWIAFLDADDEWLPDHLERASALMGETDIAYLATSRRRFVENRAQIFDYIWPAPWPRTPRNGLDRWDFLNWFSAATAFCHSSLVVSRDALQSAGGYDQSLPRRHDYELFMRLVCRGTWSFDPLPAAIFQRNTPGSISRHLVECNYFFLVGLLKNYAAFESPAMAAFLRRQARGALRYALTLGSAREIRRTWEISRPLLTPTEITIYSLLKLSPRMSGYLYRLKDGLQGRRVRLSEF